MVNCLQECRGDMGWIPGDSWEGSAAIPHELLRKWGIGVQKSWKLACAFIYVGISLRGRGPASSTQGQICPGRRGAVGPPEFTQQEIPGQGAPGKAGCLRMSLWMC